MAMLEQDGYPFVPGDKGINFARVGDDSGEQIFESGSRSRLEGFVHTGHIFIHDPEHRYSMYAHVEEEELHLDLVTVNNDDRHPDLYAGRFVRFVLTNFDRQRVVVKGFGAGWAPYRSDNWRQYRENRKSGMRPGEAALNTWSGQMITKLGFAAPTDEQVKISLDGHIDVFFPRI